MKMHEHNECEHEIKYCKVCNICYCEKCNKQWFSYSMTWYNNNMFPLNDVSSAQVYRYESHSHT